MRFEGKFKRCSTVIPSSFKILKLTEETWLISRVCTIRMCSGTQVLYILIWGGVEWQFHNSRCQKLFISKKIHTVAQLKIAKYEYCPSSLCENNYERHHPKYLNCGPAFHCIHRQLCCNLIDLCVSNLGKFKYTFFKRRPNTKWPNSVSHFNVYDFCLCYRLFEKLELSSSQWAPPMRNYSIFLALLLCLPSAKKHQVSLETDLFLFGFISIPSKLTFSVKVHSNKWDFSFTVGYPVNLDFC